jgi:hypothetical protein
MAETYKNLWKDMDLNIQEARQTPGRINSGQSMLRHITIKLSKVKNKENYENSKKETAHHR